MVVELAAPQRLERSVVVTQAQNVRRWACAVNGEWG
jgi:hypothetical protein